MELNKIQIEFSYETILGYKTKFKKTLNDEGVLFRDVHRLFIDICKSDYVRYVKTLQNSHFYEKDKIKQVFATCGKLEVFIGAQDEITRRQGARSS